MEIVVYLCVNDVRHFPTPLFSMCGWHSVCLQMWLLSIGLRKFPIVDVDVSCNNIFLIDSPICVYDVICWIVQLLFDWLTARLADSSLAHCSNRTWPCMFRIDRWTNNMYKSTLHRVVNTSARDRYSVPFFVDPNFDCVVDVLPQCLNGQAPRYAPITAGQYALSRFAKMRELNVPKTEFEPQTGHAWRGDGNTCAERNKLFCSVCWAVSFWVDPLTVWCLRGK